MIPRKSRRKDGGLYQLPCDGWMLVTCLVLALSSWILPMTSAIPPSLRYKHALKLKQQPLDLNRIADVDAYCGGDTFNITVSMEKPFKGLLFTKHFSQECSALGTQANKVDITLPTSGCGIRLNSEKTNEHERMYYSVVIVIQQDRHLRQITDQERTVECTIEPKDLLIKSEPMRAVVRDELMSRNGHRTGRMKDEGWGKSSDDDGNVGKQLDDALYAARAWMEIIPEDEDEPKGTLQVGEPTLLMVKSTLPVGIGWRVVDCNAHDGVGESSQKLLDEHGCPIDELLLPIPLKGVARPIAMMRHQEAVAKFAAFKFPDRDRLHLNCGLQLCRGACQKMDCPYNETNVNRLARTLAKGDQGEVLDRLEVFNSVEVIAPGIELDDIRQTEERIRNREASTAPFSNIPGDRTFCVSPDKMALTFCALGIIFLLAVVVAACALLRARRTGAPVPYYTRSLFTSSSSGSAYGGSKLLMHESPCLGQSTSRGMPYGRIL